MRPLVSPKTWSKQHWKIRTPRPLVDSFDLRKVHPRKEWWRERRVAPSTFVGFPDPFQPATIGFHNYAELMDPATLVLTLKHAVAKQADPSFRYNDFVPAWAARAGVLAPKLRGFEIACILRSLADLQYHDAHISLSLRSRLDAQVARMGAGDLAEAFKAVLVEGRDRRLTEKIGNLLVHLMQGRDDQDLEELMSVVEACISAQHGRLRDEVGQVLLGDFAKDALSRLCRRDVSVANLSRLANLTGALHKLDGHEAAVKGLCELMAFDTRLAGLEAKTLASLRRAFQKFAINSSVVDGALLAQLSQVDSQTAASLLPSSLLSQPQRSGLAKLALLDIDNLPVSGKVNVLFALLGESRCPSDLGRLADAVARQIASKPKLLFELEPTECVTPRRPIKAKSVLDLIKLSSLLLTQLEKDATTLQIHEIKKLRRHPLLGRPAIRGGV